MLPHMYIEIISVLNTFALLAETNDLNVSSDTILWHTNGIRKNKSEEIKPINIS